MRAMRLPLALVLLLLAGCSSFEERWAEARFEDVSYPSIYGVVLATVSAEGYAVPERDPQAGEVHTDWIYGTSRSVVRGPSRRRVHAEIAPLAERAFRVRLRVEEQVIRQGGLLATNVRESDNWEEFDDNFDDAEYLLAKMNSLLQAYHAREPEP